MVVSKKKNDSMRIGIDARLIQEKGLGRYIKNLLIQLRQMDSSNQYFIFLLKKDLDFLDIFKKDSNFHRVEADFKWYTLKEQIEFPKLLDSLDLDLLHIPHFNIPVFYRGKIVVTIHDLIHQHMGTHKASTHNKFVYEFKRLAYKHVFKKAVNNAGKILTVSNFVKKQIQTEWHIRPEKVVVTYESVDSDFIKISKHLLPDVVSKTLNKFHIKQPYIFYVGNAHPHKNIETLIDVFFLLRIENPDLCLVLSGSDNRFWPDLKNKYNNRNIIYTNRIDDEELVSLYKGAECFVTASLEEGFGLPVLEAMSVGCPVVCSNKGSLPEIGGNAALYFDPLKKEEMLKQISLVINDSELKVNLIKKGLINVSKYNWRNLADKTLAVYGDC